MKLDQHLVEALEMGDENYHEVRKGKVGKD